MDIPRQSVAKHRAIRRGIFTFLGLGAIVAITVGLSRLEPALPTVDRATVLMDSVERGSMIRQVRGTGTLVPEIVWWIPAATAGRVERILVLPGKMVTADTVLLELRDTMETWSMTCLDNLTAISEKMSHGKKNNESSESGVSLVSPSV